MTAEERLQRAHDMGKSILTNMKLNPSGKFEEAFEELVEFLAKKDELPPVVIEAEVIKN